MPQLHLSDGSGGSSIGCSPAVSQRGTVYAIDQRTDGSDGGTTMINLGSVLAQAGHRVVLVNCSTGALDVTLTGDFRATGWSFSEVLQAGRAVELAVRPGAAGLDVVPLGPTDRPPAHPKAVRSAVDSLRSQYDIILLQVDGAAKPVEGLRETIDGVVVVTHGEVLAQEESIPPWGETDSVGVVYTDRAQAADSAASSDVPIISIDLHDEAVWESMLTGRPLTTRAPESRVADAFRALAGLIVDDDEYRSVRP